MRTVQTLCPLTRAYSCFNQRCRIYIGCKLRDNVSSCLHCSRLFKTESTVTVKFHRIISYTWNLQNFICVLTILVKFDIHFLGLPWEIFFGVTTDDLLHLKPLKNVKKNAIFFKLFRYKVFVHWKLKLLNFLVDSRVKISLQFRGYRMV